MEEKEILSIIEKYPEPEGRVNGILQEIQARYRHLPREALNIVAKKLNLPLSRLYGVATFYAGFTLKPQGEHIISVCHGTACHVKGAGRITEALEECLGICTGETTPDGKFTLQAVNCLGCCSLAPVLTVDERTYGKLTPESARRIADLYKEGGAYGSC